MAWVRLDDQIFLHPKVVAAGKDATLLHLSALAYASSQLTDGFIPHASLRVVALTVNVSARGAARLVAVGLWEPIDGGYLIHDYLDYNPSATKVRGERDAAKARMQRLRSPHVRANNPDDSAERSEDVRPNNERSSANVRPSPSRALSPSPSPSPREQVNKKALGGGEPFARTPAREEMFSPSNPRLGKAELAADAAACGTTVEIYAGYIPQWADKRKGKGITSADWRADLRGFVRAALEINESRATANGHAPTPVSLGPYLVPESEMTPRELAWRRAAPEEKAMGERAFMAAYMEKTERET